MSEFDEYAQKGYHELIDDSLKTNLCGGSDFFLNQKVTLLDQTIFKESRPSTHLDLGCGEGELCQKLKPKLSFSYGLDVSKGMLKKAIHDVAIYDGHHLPFKDNSFDLITCICVYHHIPPSDRLNFSQEVLRVLKPEGSFIIFEHNPFNPLTRWIVSRTPVDQNAILVKSSEFKKQYLYQFIQHRQQYYLFFPKKLSWLEKALYPILKFIPLGGQYLYWVKKNHA